MSFGLSYLTFSHAGPLLYIHNNIPLVAIVLKMMHPFILTEIVNVFFFYKGTCLKNKQVKSKSLR